MNVKKAPERNGGMEQVGGDRENAFTMSKPSTKVKPSVENNLLTAALKYAARGKPVFPCSLDKKPLTQNGFKDATTDAATIQDWWGKHPQASIGMPTGEVSGIFVLDVDVADGKQGRESLAALEDKYGKLPETLCIRTGSGGRHFYFQYPAGHELGNSTGKLGQGLDTRGEGGYVIMPPSRHVSGGNYKVENLGTPLADLSAEFINLLEKPKFEERPAISKPHPTRAPGELPPYVQKAIDGELQKLATTQKGERNDALNKAAYALGQWVGGGYISENYAESLLWKAGNDNGLALEDATECRKTIQSGLTAGMKEPRAIPDRSTATEMPVEGTKTGNVESSSDDGEAPEKSALVCVNALDFMSMEFPARGMILSPILPSQGLVMVHAYRGIGKTLFAQYISYVIACGGAAFDRWSAPHPSKVLYIDGEMPAAALRERFLSIVAGQDKQPNDPDNLQIITPDLQASAMPNLATEAGQKAVEPFLNDVKLVVIDNLSTLARHGRANEEESWMPVQRWVLEQRRRGISVLLVHHDGKNFTQRGTSSKEDILDTVIGLKKPDDYEPEQGARFEVRFEKARGILGDDVKSFECHLVQEGDALVWKTRDIVDAKLDQLESLLDEGLSIRECAAEMGISKSAVQRLKAKLVGRKK